MGKEREKFRERILIALGTEIWLLDRYKSLAKDLQMRTGVKYRVGTNDFGFTQYLLIDRFFENNSFDEFLDTLENLIAALREFDARSPISIGGRSKWLVEKTKEALNYSKIDFGVRFNAEQGIFYPSGAKLLDDRLVNEELRWLSENQYTKVYEPFEKGLRFLLEARNDSSKLQNVVTDLHEALEAFAKIVCGNDRDLSGNRDRFISALNLNPYYQKMFKEYINYANEFRHAEKQRKPRPDLKYEEIEAFVYLTGVFIRLGIEKLKSPQTSTS